MIYKEHLIEIWVNGKKLELESQKDINLRLNNVLFNPEKITSTQAEYSFEFEIPSTPVNDKIFDYANNLSKLNKFHLRWNAEVIADGSKIFEGSLALKSYKAKKYTVNLVSVKTYSLEDIFGDMTMDKIKWYVPFNGAGVDTGFTINYYNSLTNSDVTFPFVSYGVFQKSPKSEDEVGSEYTSKFDIDEYNRFYIESFPPSHNMLATLRKAFETKDYFVGGDAFVNEYLKNIYMSLNLDDGQIPTYNLGHPKFGSVSLSASLSTSGKTSYMQELNFPYFKVYGNVETGVDLDTQTEYNLSSVDMYDVLGEGNVTVNAPSYMYQPNEHIIVIPASGFYKIEMTVSSSLNESGNISVGQYTYDPLERKIERETLELPVGFSENTPIEVALVRNYEDSYEMIKGKRNRNYYNGNPNDETYSLNGSSYSNVRDWLTCYPHEDPYNSTLPTEQNDLTLNNTQGNRREDGSVSSHVGKTRGESLTHQPYGGSDGEGGRYWSPSKLGYVYKDGEIMAYDQAVSKSFICGFSSFYGGVTSVMKNGYSWSKSIADENQAFYPEIGYSFMRRNGSGGTDFEETQYNYNTYINTPISYVSSTDNSMNGYVSCMVWLEKDDILQVMAVHRGYTTTGDVNVHYATTTNVSIKVTAASPRSYHELKADNYTYESPTEFDIDLNLANFLNRGKKVSEWVQNVADAFNLEIIQNGNTVNINTKNKVGMKTISAVDIDDRVNGNEIESSMIDYPKSMAVKYKIDTDEWGFERSAVDANNGDESILNNDDWKKYGDSGFTEIMLADDSYVTTTSEKSIQFSYTWYDNFKWYAVNDSFIKVSNTPATIRIPVISKYTYMIDGYSYEESMKNDGYGLPQRFWFKPSVTNEYVWTRTYPTEVVFLSTPINAYGNPSINLSYKDTEKSILTQFFDIKAYLSSNYVQVDVYLSPDEYNRIKNGCMVHLDSDLYIPVEISGFDASGNNPTTLKMMKRIV